MRIENLVASDVARWLAERSIVLIDVREPAEFAAERIHGALLCPLSTFDPKALPEMGQRKLVFHCGTGMRSEKAINACQAAGLPYAAHLEGGIQAWKRAGFSTITVDPQTGLMRETR